MRLPDEHGVSRFERLRLFEKRTGKRHADLDGPPCDGSLLYVYGWWRELDDARSNGMNGPNPVGYSELHAWAQLTKRVPTVDEVQTMRRIDSAYLRMYATEAAKRMTKDRKGKR
jgi:hypothetical protein